MLEIKVLNAEAIQKLNDKYRTRSMAVDKKGVPYISNGEVAFRTERDYARASRHILVEALVYPNLKDPDLMAFYNCHDITDMPFKVFPKHSELTHVNRVVMAALGIVDAVNDTEEKESVLDEVKN